MKKFILSLTILVGFGVPHLPAAEPDLEATAVATMIPWLESIDAADYAKSYSEASARFQSAVTQAQWVAALGQVRAPLGSLESRAIASATELSVLPDGTTGEFLLAQFDTVYEKLPAATETVTFERGTDGNWRAGGYYIRPGKASN